MALGSRMATLVALLTCLTAPAARSTASDARGTVEVVSDLPLHAGAAFWFGLPSGWIAGTSLGQMPRAYVDLINTASIQLGGMDSETAEVVEHALAESLVWRARTGWQRAGAEAFYAVLGYSLITLGGGAKGESLLRLATENPNDEFTEALSYDLASTLHLVDIEVGWTWTFDETYTLRVGAGFIATVTSHTTVTPSLAPSGDAGERLKAFTDAVAARLDATYQASVFSPTFSLALGWRLF